MYTVDKSVQRKRTATLLKLKPDYTMFMVHLSPKEIVKQLDRYIIGQMEAKRCVANSLRNRQRRQIIMKTDPELANEIIPKNILMVGPTGVGKTEIARRIAKQGDYPYIKVEATKFTEVGYVGRDVDSIIRDLVDKTIAQLKDNIRRKQGKHAHKIATKKVIDALVGNNASENSRELFRQRFEDGELDDVEIELELPEVLSQPGASFFDLSGGGGNNNVGMINLGEILSKAMGNGKRTRMTKSKVRPAYEALFKDEVDSMIDENAITQEAIKKVENDGIVFIDEIDKIAGNERRGSDISREGVQRDLLPLVEGTVVNTKHGPVKTDHILFIASGAFHISKPADLLPELQGRFPVRVELLPLGEDDLIRILREPQFNLIKQYCALLAVDKVELSFTDDGIACIARIAADMNQRVENIGARRLHSLLEKLMEDLSFIADEARHNLVVVDEEYVRVRLAEAISMSGDRSKFIL